MIPAPAARALGGESCGLCAHAIRRIDSSDCGGAARRPLQVALWPLRLLLIAATLLPCLTGCGGTLGEVASKVGLGASGSPAAPALPASPPPNPEALKALLPKALEEAARASQPRNVTVRLHGADRLNVDAAGRSLSLVARIYTLSGTEQFQLLTAESLSQDAIARDHPAQREILAVREVVLPPGRRHEIQLMLPPAATHVAVVGLFHSPAVGRWRFLFSADEAARSGVTLGLHACALSVGAGEPIGTDPELRRLAGVRCPAEPTSTQASTATSALVRSAGQSSSPPP